MVADAEQIAILSDVFNELKFNFVIKINNRKLLNGILKQAGVQKTKEALVAIDKLGKIGSTGVVQELTQKGYAKKQIDKIISLITKEISVKDLAKKITDEEGKQGILELQELLDYCKMMGIKNVEFDISLARGQAYYTGTVIEAYLKKSAMASSIAGGGRYDNMIGGFMEGGREVPAVGISFGITPIMEELKRQQQMKEKTRAQVYIIPINTLSESLKIVQELRKNGINTDVALGKKGVSKNLEYANTLGIPYVIIIGENELQKKKVLLRDMEKGTEQIISLQRVIRQLQ